MNIVFPPDSLSPSREAYLMCGATPPGAKSLPSEPGCPRKRKRMRAIIRTGKRITKPNGAVMVELPHKRNGLLRKAMREFIVFGRKPWGFSLSRLGSWIARVDAPRARRIGSLDMLWAGGGSAPPCKRDPGRRNSRSGSSLA